MALTLQCVCPDAQAKLCNVTQLVWNAGLGVLQIGSVEALCVYRLGATGHVGYGGELDGDSSGSFDLPLATWIPLWNAMYTELIADSSGRQVPDPPFSQYTQATGTCWIDIHYQCIDTITGAATTRVVQSYPILAGFSQCETAPGDIRSKCFGGSTSVATLYKSTPLGACNGCAAITSDFEPKPDANSLDVSSNACLCAEGGSGDYEFSIIAGNLPSGQKLNPITGCIEGDPDGKVPGSTSVTFQVLDHGGAAIPPTGGVTTTGTANVFGAGATKLSGPDWDSSMAGRSITIAGVVATVASVTDINHLTLTSTIGIFPGTTWSYTSAVIPPPDPAAPQMAQVTCGFQGGGCGEGGIASGNVAY